MAQPTKPDYENDSEIRKAYAIHPEAMEEEYASCPSQIARWGFRFADASEALQQAELDLETGEAKLKLRFRKEAEERHEKITVDQVEALVISSVDYRRLSEAVITTSHEKAKALAMLDALRAKKDMLVSLGAHQREAMQQNLRINERKPR